MMHCLTQGIGRNEVKNNVITNEEGRDNGNGRDSIGCVDVLGRRRDWYVINLYEQENTTMEWRDCLIAPMYEEE